MSTNFSRPGLAQVFEDLAREKGSTVNELAGLAQLSPSQLSKLRSGAVQPTMGMVERLARAFAARPDDPNDIENTKAVILLAGGYKPGATRRKELIDVLELEAELAEERKVETGQEIWIYSRRLIETEDPRVLETVRDRLHAGVKYRFFIHPEHAMDCVTFRQKLENLTPPIGAEAYQIVVIHKEAFMFADNRMSTAILNASSDDNLRCFKARKPASGVGLRYVEVDPAEGIEYRDFLQEMRKRADDADPSADPTPPCQAEIYARHLIQKLMPGGTTH